VAETAEKEEEGRQADATSEEEADHEEYCYYCDCQWATTCLVAAAEWRSLWRAAAASEGRMTEATQKADESTLPASTLENVLRSCQGDPCPLAPQTCASFWMQGGTHSIYSPPLPLDLPRWPVSSREFNSSLRLLADTCASACPGARPDERFALLLLCSPAMQREKGRKRKKLGS
jgi:hypothetical protein